jgi:hypothetical protein
MSECLGAGSGCGWCVPFLERIWADPDGIDLGELAAEDYASARQEYLENR